MATATAPGRLAPEILAERLRSAVTRGRRVMEPDGSLGMAHDNHRDFYRWERTVERIACETYGEHLRPSEVEEVDEIAARLWDQMGTEIVAWAGGLESRGIAR